MSRRRYISTDISTDTKIAELAQYGTLPLLLYTWAVPHMDDWGRMTGDPRQFKLLVCPALDVTGADVEEALNQIASVGLWQRYQVQGKWYIATPESSFYKYQTYINRSKRETNGSQFPPPPNTEERRKSPQTTEEQQQIPPNTEEHRIPSPSPSPSLKEHTYTAADVYQDEEISEQLKTIANPINPYWPKFIADCMNNGMTRDAVLLAIKRDINKGRRTFSGIEKRLKDWRDKRIFTLIQVQENDAKVFDIQAKKPRAPDTVSPPVRMKTDDELRMEQLAKEIEEMGGLG